MNNLSKKTISEIVTEDYRTAPVFEKYGLDYCCKGKLPLEEACRNNNIPQEEVERDINLVISKGKETQVFEEMTMTALADYIVRVHHLFCKVEMPQISHYIMKVILRHGDKYPYMKEVNELFNELKKDMDDHMQKEEKILFPAIREIESNPSPVLPSESISIPVSVMTQEHERAGEILEKIRELTSDYFADNDACTTFRLTMNSLAAFEKDLHWHVHLENNILFPRAMRLSAKLDHVHLN